MASPETASPAWIIDAFTFAALHWQHGEVPLNLRWWNFLGFLAAQAGFSQTSSHFGRGHKVGFLHFQSEEERRKRGGERE